MKMMSLSIDGMSCSHCVRNVRKSLGTVPGVTIEDVTVGSAAILYDPTATTAEAIVEAVRAGGYDARAVA